MEPVLDEAIDRWVDADLLAADQAVAIRDHEAARDADGGAEQATPRRTIVAEGLAYVGAALALGAGATVLGDVWDDLAEPVRLLVAVLATAAVAVGAWALRDHEDGPARRLATLLGSLAALGVATCAGLATRYFVDPSDDVVALVVGAAGLVSAVPLHRVRPSWPTTLVLGASVATTVIAGAGVLGVELDATASGILLAALGLAWAALGWSGHLRPRTPVEVTGLLAGGIGCQVLAVESAFSGVGFEPTAFVGTALGLLVGLGVVAIGVTEDRTGTAALGGLGVTVFAPQLLLELLPDEIGGPLALLVAGVGLVVLAVLLLRRTTKVLP